ncbi:MAG TPA: N-acyl homoserine lactonase family protein [Gemmatimonadaceae bacterium]|jgi:glyoxylase-like metal-dependent hydrolase (beta-lactamase superfamily II)
MRVSSIARAAACVAALLVVGCGGRAAVNTGSGSAAMAATTKYNVYAVRYGTLPAYKVSGLVVGADTSRRLDIAMMVWLIQAPGRNILLDAGFHRDDLIKRYHPTDYMTPAQAVAKTGVQADQVTDLIISHIHWDHLDGIDLFPKARIWIQKDEFNYYVDSAGNQKNRTIDAGDAKLLAAAAREGRVELVPGDGVEIIPGISVYTGGKHTFASQFASVQTTSGTVVLASDNMYLYENEDKHVPIAQSLDKDSNLRTQDRMKAMASAPRLLIPGHDPLVFVRFPNPGNGIAWIK